MAGIGSLSAPFSKVVRARPDRRVLLSAAMTATALVGSARGQELPVLGVTGAHDPSTIIQEGTNYYYYVTGQGIVARTSTNLTNWNNGTTVFSTQPAWTSTAVPGNTGDFWAPDVIFRNNQYYMYYSVSTFGSQVSAIGLATSPTLNPTDPNYGWTDQQAVIQSTNGSAYNTIDPSLLQNSDGTLWMSFGSFWNGIYLAQLNPTTGKLLAGTSITNIAENNSNNSNSYFNGIEASYLLQHDGFYYLFENWGACCDGVSSTYNIRVGRSTSINGPYVDENGVALTAGGGSLFLASDGNQIGPGQFSFFTNGTQQEFGYHYYDGNTNGAPTEGIRDLFWTASDWPSIAAVNPNWVGGTNANWSTAANWSDTVPNAAGSIANFVSATAANRSITIDGGTKTVATLNFNSTGSYTIGSATGNGLILDSGNTNDTTINVEFGSHTIAAPITAKENLSVDVILSTSQLILGSVSGLGLNKYGVGTVSLSATNSYTSNVLVHQGTLDITGTVTAGSFNSIGQVAGDTGVMNVHGSGSFTSASDLNIGDTGASNTPATGTLNLSGSGQITINSGGGFYVGSGFSSNTEANGTVFQSGGTLTANGTTDGGFTIGGRTSKLAIGIYNLSAGTVNANTNVWDGGFGTGTMNQTGGTFQSALFLSIGRQTGGKGIWNISAGTLNQTNSADWLVVGEAGTGTLNISGTAQVTTAGVIKIGQTGGTGTINLDGGTLITPAIQQGTGAANFDFSGGTLKPSTSTTAFMPTTVTTKVQAGGAIIDTNGFNITIPTALRHDTTLGTNPDGGLSKNGLGTLTLSGAESYTGATTVNNGTLTLATGSSLISTSVTVATGATLNANAGSLSSLTKLNSNGATTFGSNPNSGILPLTLAGLTVGSSGAVTASSPSSHTNRTVLVTGALSFSNPSSGTLNLTSNDLIVHNGSASTIFNEIAQGQTTSATPAGITSSVVATGAANTALGMELNDDGTGTNTPLMTTFDGQPVGDTDVLVKYTFAGDADLSGTIDATDYSLIDNGFTNQLTGWRNGDFNYDGVVNGDDYTLIDNAFNTQGTTTFAALPATPSEMIATDTAQIATAIPEPGSLALVSILAGGLLMRRRRELLQ
jgi:autotransporter-associated beta strand protein